jgi:transcription initiation factor TFIID subunit 10
MSTATTTPTVPEPSQTLSTFLGELEDYQPTVPEQLTKFYLERSGLNVKDENIARLVSLAADKVLADILHGAQQRAMLKRQRQKSKNKEVKDLEMDDLEGSLADVRIFLRRKKVRLDK